MLCVTNWEKIIDNQPRKIKSFDEIQGIAPF